MLSFSPKNFIITNDSFSGILQCQSLCAHFLSVSQCPPGQHSYCNSHFFFTFQNQMIFHTKGVSLKKTTPILHFGLSCSLFSSLSFPICYFINLHRTLKVFAYFSFSCAIINIPFRPKGSSNSLKSEGQSKCSEMSLGLAHAGLQKNFLQLDKIQPSPEAHEVGSHFPKGVFFSSGRRDMQLFLGLYLQTYQHIKVQSMLIFRLLQCLFTRTWYIFQHPHTSIWTFSPLFKLPGLLQVRLSSLQLLLSYKLQYVFHTLPIAPTVALLFLCRQPWPYLICFFCF